MTTPLTTCQACGGGDLDPFYEVRDVPVHSCLMVDSRAAALAFPRGDLRLDFCRSCGFVQNALYDAGLQNYSPDYEETQAFSAHFMRWLEGVVDDQIDRHGLRGKTVVEIGCGKGEFLVLLCERGDNYGIGIDPGYRPERTGKLKRGQARFIQDFYSERHANLTGDYVGCRHTLEHIGPVRDFVGLIRRTLRPSTPVFFELPDFERVLVERAFWDIYYEHCSYFTSGSLVRLFAAHGFDVLRIEKDYGGQYLMLDCRAAERPASHAAAADVGRVTEQVELFRSAVRAKLEGLDRFVRAARERGERIAVWGSGSKAVSLLTTTGLGEAFAAVVDINPHKHGKFLAGTGHEIVSPHALKALRPDHVLVMNPVYEHEIRQDLVDLGLSPELVALEDIPGS